MKTEDAVLWLLVMVGVSVACFISGLVVGQARIKEAVRAGADVKKLLGIEEKEP